MASCCCFGPTKYSNRMAVIFWMYILGMIGILVYQLIIGIFILMENSANLERGIGNDDSDLAKAIFGLFAALAAIPLAFLLTSSIALNCLLSSELTQGASVQMHGMDEKATGMLRYGSVQLWLHVGYTLGWYLYLLLTAVGELGRFYPPTSYYVLLVLFCGALLVLLIFEFIYFWHTWASFSAYLETEPTHSESLVNSSGYERLDA